MLPLPRLLELALIALSALLVAGCGNGQGSTASPDPPSVPGGGAVPLATPSVVSVTAGQTAGGVDITVGPRAASALNARVLGVDSTAQNTGAIVRRGTVTNVILFGPGLSASLQVTISGPADITISNLQTIESTTGTPGIAFDAMVAADAAPGARTVVLVSPAGNVTTFTGGLEVLP